MIIQILVAVVAVYLLLVIATALFQRLMIYHPGRSRPEPAQVGLPEMVAVQIPTADGWLISGWYAPTSKADRVTIVFYHGNSGTIADRADKARRMLDAGHGVLLVGYRGFGGNPGTPSELGLVNDGRAALHWLIGKGVPQCRIVLYGESLGTGIVTRLAGEIEDLSGIILESPFTDLADLAPGWLLPGLPQLLMADRFNNRARIGAVTAPLMIIHGERDDLVPLTMGRELLGRARVLDKRGIFLPEAGHNDVWAKGGEEPIMEFLAERTQW